MRPMVDDEWTVERHLQGKPSDRVSLFRFFRELVATTTDHGHGGSGPVV
jgi:hypothetical protein